MREAARKPVPAGRATSRLRTLEIGRESIKPHRAAPRADLRDFSREHRRHDRRRQASLRAHRPGLPRSPRRRRANLRDRDGDCRSARTSPGRHDAANGGKRSGRTVRPAVASTADVDIQSESYEVFSEDAAARVTQEIGSGPLPEMADGGTLRDAFAPKHLRAIHTFPLIPGAFRAIRYRPCGALAAAKISGTPERGGR